VTGRIVDPLATTDALSALFGDASALRALLEVEAALALAQASIGVIPATAAATIARVAAGGGFDVDSLVRAARVSGTIAIPLVAALTAKVEAVDPDAARYVHWGATSQDIVDTAMSLLIEHAGHPLKYDHTLLAEQLRLLSDRHKDTVMLGRTLLQPAPPTTFGLKVAGWYASLSRSWARLEQAWHDAARVQLGGAVGTLAALGDRGLAVVEAMGGPGQPLIMLPSAAGPWHSARDRIAALVTACAIYGGVLAKMARDVSLLMQFEVGEAHEAGGGSSAMPHKQNPSGCARALSAAARLPGLSATVLAGLAQEHERGVGGWLVEWPVVADAMQATGAALEAMREVMAGLTVDPDRMRAQAFVKDALARLRAEGGTLADAVRAEPELARVIADTDLRALEDPRAYLGSAETVRQRLIAAASPAPADAR
jgi:3-carboxy-cis,cis-muconate cycloisomerase